MPNKLLLLIFLFFCSFQLATAQDKNVKIEPAKDTARMYKSIEKFSKRNKFTKFVHGLIFEPIRVKKDIAKATPKKVEKQDLRPFEGKIVRKINVETLDPFGYSEKDTTRKPTKYLSKVGNRIHLKSKVLTIKNLLLIKRNRPLDSLLIRESERLVRSQRYVRAVLITPVLISATSDSVDVNIRVLDSWSLIPDVSGSNNDAVFDITERNFLGLGHQFENSYEREFSTGEDAYSTRYSIPNILNTYIKAAIAYQIDIKHNYNKSINIERPFFSPFTRWAAGAFIEQRFRQDTVPSAINVYARQNFKYNTQDFWAGHSYQIFRGNTENDRTTNLINTVRYLKINYLESPTVEYDSVNFYSDEKFYLTGIGLSSRQFVEDKYIFNYGVVEDVPVGRGFGITAGWQQKNNVERLYAGARVTLAKYYKFGYLSSNFEYGSFFNNGAGEQSAISVQSSYFTNLMVAGRWKFRHFIKSRLVLGKDREPSRGDRITINDRFGIPGFNPNLLIGTKKFVTTIQSQGYSPWNFGGFRLNPYVSYTMALLGDANQGLSKSRLYSQLGAGFIITNDYLVFSSFQLSVAYYPNIPGSGDNVFKTNAFNTEDFGFQNLEIAKPRTVDYE